MVTNRDVWVGFTCYWVGVFVTHYVYWDLIRP